MIFSLYSELIYLIDLQQFLIDHPKFLGNPLYISGISYMGIVTPIVTLEVYNGKCLF